MPENLFPKRLHHLSLLFLLCFSAVVLRALQVGWIEQEKYLQTGQKISLRHVTLPPRRGEIKDQNNVKLVWNERQFDLFLLRTPEKFSQSRRNRLKTLLPGRSLRFEKNQPVCQRLTAAEITQLEPLIKRGFPVRIRPTLLRQKLNHPSVLARAGKVTRNRGNSGWEAQYDKILSGTPGLARVTLDRRRNWMPGSWDLYKAPVHGKDVVLDLDIKSIQGDKVKK